MQLHLRQLKNKFKNSNMTKEDQERYEFIVHILFMNSRQKYVRDLMYQSFISSSKGKPMTTNDLKSVIRMRPLSQKEKVKSYVIRGISCNDFLFPVGSGFVPETPFSPLPRYIIRNRQKENSNMDLKQTLPIVKSVLSVSASLIIASHGFEFFSSMRSKYQNNKRIQHDIFHKNVKKNAQEKLEKISQLKDRIHSLVNIDEYTFSSIWEPPSFTHGIRIYPQPSILSSCLLHQHQIEGMSWLIHLYTHRVNGILADDVGLGKSLQIIAFLAFLREQKRISGPHLIVMPGAVLSTWKSEFEKWFPSANVISYIGKKRKRENMIETYVFRTDFDVMLTSYSILEVDKEILSQIPWHVIVFDEGHLLKNPKTNLFNTINDLFFSDFRIIATATPFQNEIDEFWALLYLISPREFCSLNVFHSFFSDLYDLSDKNHEIIIKRLHKIIRPYLLRRNKEELDFDIPNKLEITIKSSPCELQKEIIERSLEANPTTQQKLVLSRKVSNSPVLLLNRKLFNDIPVEYILLRSPKMRILDRILEKLVMTQHRFLIYSQWTKMMDIITRYFEWKNYKCLRIDGSTTTTSRIEIIQKFIAPGSEYVGMLLSTRSSAFGLNLQVADTVILFDSDYNPFVELQASARVHRLGQTNIVVVIRLMMNETGEEKILRVSRKKFILGHQIIEAGKFNLDNDSRDQQALNNAETKAPEVLNPSDEKLNTVIARSNAELGILQCSNYNKALDEKESYKEIDAEIIDKLDDAIIELEDA